MKIILFLALSFNFAHGTAPFSFEKKEMNGIHFSKYKNFEKKWKLVTVRFRKDTEELRFTYANPLAYKALTSGVIDYPEGAVFAKIGVKTDADPAFESSAVPQGARRYQFMVRNKKSYKKDSGWGYALFDERGLTFPEDHVTQVEACVACHSLVPERGYVFSQLMNVSARTISKKLNIQSRLVFEMVPTDKLPENLKKLIPTEFNYVRILKGKLTEKIFQGTLEEVRPALSLESYESKLPAILTSKENTRFSIVIPEQMGSQCHSHGKMGVFLKSVYTLADLTLKELHYCYTR